MVWMAVTVPSWPSFVLRAAFKETEQSAVGTLAEFGEKLAIVAEVDTQYFRQSKDVLAVRDGRKDRAAQQAAELDLLFVWQLGQNQRPLQLNNSRYSWRQSGQHTLAKPSRKSPHFR